MADTLLQTPRPGDALADVQAYWNRRPCNVGHSRRPVGTREYFDDVEARRYFVEPHIPAFAQFPRWKGKRVLEIGCGIGTDAINFARAGADVTLVEFSEASLTLCRQRFETFGLTARFHLGNAEELDQVLPAEPYDLIYSFGVLHHTPRPERAVARLARYCGPQTELRIMLYSKWSWKVLWILATYGRWRLWKLPELVRRYSEAQEGCPVTFVYSFREVRRLFRDYDVVELRKAHIFPYVISRYLRYEYERVWYFRWMPAPVFSVLCRWLGWHTLIVARAKPAAASEA